MRWRGLHVRPRFGSEYNEELLSLNAFSDGTAARRLVRPLGEYRDITRKEI